MPDFEQTVKLATGSQAATSRNCGNASKTLSIAATRSRRPDPAGRCRRVVTADPGREFAFRTVPERVHLSRRDSTTWTYLFTPEATGTRVIHAYELTLLPLRPFLALYRRAVPQHADMRPAMMSNLTALKSAAKQKARTHG